MADQLRYVLAFWLPHLSRVDWQVREQANMHARPSKVLEGSFGIEVDGRSGLILTAYIRVKTSVEVDCDANAVAVVEVPHG